MGIDSFPRPAAKPEIPNEPSSRVPARFERPTLEKLTSGKVIHGMGHAPFTLEQIKDIDALLSSVGSSLDDVYIKNLEGSTRADIIDYVSMRPPYTDDRKILAEAIKAAVVSARDNYRE